MIVAALANGLWQGALIFAIALALSHAVSKRNAATRYALWFATLLALALVPLATAFPGAAERLLGAFLPHPAGTTSYTVTLIPATPFAHSAGAWFAPLAPWVLAAWIGGVCVGGVRLMASFLRIERIRRNAQPLAKYGSGVLLSSDVTVPIVAGIFAPAIVLPKGLPRQLAANDLQRIILHERAHVRRNDALLNLIQRLIEVVLFFNPWVRLISNRVSEEREIACDDWVVERDGHAYEYAICLAALAQSVGRGNAPLLTPSALRSRRTLVSRIERLSSGEPRALTINAYTLGGTVMLFIIAAFLLQAVAPAVALTPTNNPDASSSMLAASCARPNADAQVLNAVAPDLPHGLKATGKVDVVVTIAPSGRVTGATVLHSSGNTTIDDAVVKAAKASSYSPRMSNCTAVQGSYVFHAEFTPD